MMPSPAFITDTIETFARLGQPISKDEAVEIIANVGRLIELTGRLSRKSGEINYENRTPAGKV